MKKVSIFAILLSAVMLAGCTAAGDSAQPTPTAAAETPSTAPAQAAYQTITPDDAKELIGTSGVVLLDVRTREEFDEAHIDGATLVPYDALDQNVDKLPEGKDTTIIVYCRSGRRSAIAAETLIGMGYTQVFDLGGIQDWPYDTVTG